VHFGHHPLDFIDAIGAPLAENFLLGDRANYLHRSVDIVGNKLAVSKHATLEINTMVVVTHGANALSYSLSLSTQTLVFILSRIRGNTMEYDFLIHTYDTERLKTLNVWSMFKDEDLLIRPSPLSKRDRNPLEHMLHQCLSENKWFCTMLSIDVGAPPLPETEMRLEFMKRYAEDSGKRLTALQKKKKSWWEQETTFFDTKRTIA
jgi:hypothetical protein